MHTLVFYKSKYKKLMYCQYRKQSLKRNMFLCDGKPTLETLGVSQRVQNKKVRHETKSSGVTVLYTLWRLLWSITVHTHGICVFYTIEVQIVYWRIFGEIQVCWRDLTWIWRHLWANAHRSLITYYIGCLYTYLSCITQTSRDSMTRAKLLGDLGK